MTAHDALGAHARDELGISEALAARPLQAAWTSAASFSVGAVLPLLVTALTPQSLTSSRWWRAPRCCSSRLLGGVAARAGGAGVMTGALRVTFWGALAMALTAVVGRLFGTVV